jgi:anti-sigma-K factor RskA
MTEAHDHSRWADSPAAYLLGALDEDERAGFEAHLIGCSVCREEVDYLRVATDALPVAARQVPPPPELKDRIMAIVNSEAELLRAAGPNADRVAAAPARRRFALRSGGRWSLRPSLALGAAVLAIAVGVGVGLAGRGALDSSGSTRTVVAQVTVPDAAAKLIVRDEDHSTLVTHGLPHPSPGRIYQVWLKHRGRPDAEPTDALFNVRSDGSASVDVPGSMKDVEAVMVTSEPDGGSQVPTRKPVIVASPT